MKKQTYTMIAAVLVAGCLAISAEAQCGSVESTAKIPFQFNAGQTTLPAGEYRITCQAAGYGPGSVRLTNGASNVNLVAATVVGKAREHGVLVFHRYGDRYFLEQFWPAGEEMGERLPQSRAERELQRESGSIRPEKPMIALIPIMTTSAEGN